MEKDGQCNRLRLHDYHEFFRYPGLYETVMVDHLKCKSPEVVCDMLCEHMDSWLGNQDQVHVLDMGAGNGMVGEQLKKHLDCETLVGGGYHPPRRRWPHPVTDPECTTITAWPI